MKITRYQKRTLFLMFCIMLLLINIILVIAYQPVYKKLPNPFLCKLPFQQQEIINQSYKIHFKFLESVQAFLFGQPYTENSNLKTLTGQGRFFTNYFNILLNIIYMFYIYYRLSRTGIDEFIFNMEIVK